MKKDLPKNNPLVSIGIPTYNRPKELERCIKNLLHQTYENIEIIICDNNSEDPLNRKLYSSKLFKNKKIRIFYNQKNIGVLKNTIKVLKMAKGKYFCWMSDDDWRSNVFIEEMLNDIKCKGNDFIVFCNYVEILNNNRLSNKHKSFRPNLKLLSSENSWLRKLYYYFLDNASGKCNLFYSLISTDKLKKINFKEITNNWTDLSMDKNIVQLLLNDNKVYINPKKLAANTVENKKFYQSEYKVSLTNKRIFSKFINILKEVISEKDLFLRKNNYLLIRLILECTLIIKLATIILNRLSIKLHFYNYKFLNNKRYIIEEKAINKIETSLQKKYNKKFISDTTLVSVATKEVEKAAMALKYSMADINFEKVLLLSNYIPWNLGDDISFKTIKSFKDVGEWGKFIIFDLHKYIKTKFIILIHPDGFIVNPNMWDERFKNYDYIGAPWPKPKDNFSYRTPKGRIIEVGNSVSIRSRSILKLPSELGMQWKEYYGNFHEDGYLCVHKRDELESQGIIFAKKDIAYKFGIENDDRFVKSANSFTFHKWAGNNKKYPNFKKY